MTGRIVLCNEDPQARPAALQDLQHSLLVKAANTAADKVLIQQTKLALLPSDSSKQRAAEQAVKTAERKKLETSILKRASWAKGKRDRPQDDETQAEAPLGKKRKANPRRITGKNVDAGMATQGAITRSKAAKQGRKEAVPPVSPAAEPTCACDDSLSDNGRIER